MSDNIDIDIEDAARPNPEDLLRLEFLRDLDDAEHIDLTDWEAKFVESNLDRTSFSVAQRTVIDSLRHRYENKL